MKKFKKIYIEITNRCNLKCSFCPQDNLPKREMTKGEFETIIKKIDKYTDYIYLHVKGEPLLHSNFEQIIDIALKYNKQVNITTNGTLLYKHLNTLTKVRQINVSLQSLTNIADLDQIIECCNNLSSNTYISYRLWVKNKFEDEIRNKIILKKNIYLSEEKEFVWPSLDNNICNMNGNCLGTKDHIAILVDGTVIPCCLDSKGIINLGNIYNSSLDDILSSERFIKINKGFSENKRVEKLCQKCGFKINR